MVLNSGEGEALMRIFEVALTLRRRGVTSVEEISARIAQIGLLSGVDLARRSYDFLLTQEKDHHDIAGLLQTIAEVRGPNGIRNSLNRIETFVRKEDAVAATEAKGNEVLLRRFRESTRGIMMDTLRSDTKPSLFYTKTEISNGMSPECRGRLEELVARAPSKRKSS